MQKKWTLLLLLAGTATACLAQTYTAPSSLYLKTVNSYLPPSPESAQLIKYQDFPVNLFTGTQQVSIPIYTCAGKGISVPISISYHASGGVRVDDEATNVGLGFSLIAGGEITRDMRGQPDEGSSGSTGYLQKPLKMSEYVLKYNDGAGTYQDQQLWVDAMNGHFDLEPDIFYFNFGGYSGKFVYDDVPEKFVCLDETSHLDIQFDHSNASNSFFTLTTDDGNQYTFAARETSASQVVNKGYTGGTSTAGAPVITSWKLTKIVNADRTDSIVLNYVSQFYHYFTSGANIEYERVDGPARKPVLSYNDVTIGGTGKLASITGTNFSVTFTDETADRTDLPAGNKALSKIIIKDRSQAVQDIFVLHHSYFSRSLPVGVMPVINDLLTNSLRLDSISEYGNSEANPYPIRHAFSYDGTQLPARLSFAKDWWGYPNNNTYSTSLVPRFLLNGDGAVRTPMIGRTSAGILTQVRLPTGGTVSYEYEPNTTAMPIAQAAPPEDQTLTVFQTINQPAQGTSTINTQTITFSINVPPNENLNDGLGGVTANITFFPTAPGNGVGYVNNMPYYTLVKVSNIDGSPIGGNDGFIRNLQTAPEFGVHLPNGNYQMTYNANGYSTPPPIQGDGGPPGGNLSFFTVGYHIPDPNAAFANYSLAGVRVKSITTRDPYSRITQTRRFRYHDPVTDSSYGHYIGMARNVYWEVSQFGQWKVHNANFNMPGQGNVSNSVVYPKVLEEVTEGGVTHRTEHYFTKAFVPSYGSTFPFVPALDFELKRGSEYKTIVNKYSPSGYTPAAISLKNFNLDPVSLSGGTAFSHPIQGMKCAATSYDIEVVGLNGNAPPLVGIYPIAIGNRAYLASDSSITYDLNNAYSSATTWHDYTYGDYNLQPIVVRSGNSDGTVSIQKNYYAADKPEADGMISAAFCNDLVTANRVSMPVATKQYRDATPVSRMYTYGHVDGSKLLVDSIYQNLENYTPDKEAAITRYDGAANPLVVALRGGKYRRYLWNQATGLPLATCVMYKNVSFAFTSFEFPNEYQWTEGNRGTVSAFAGSYSYNLSNAPIGFPGFEADGGIDVYVWATTSDVNVNALPMESTGRTKGSWTLYHKYLTLSSSVSNPGALPGTPLSISGSARIDNLAVIPTGGQFQGQVYDNANRVTAVVNDGIYTGFFEYDAFGRLQNVRDEQGNIVKSTAYQYQGAQ